MDGCGSMEGMITLSAVKEKTASVRGASRLQSKARCTDPCSGLEEVNRLRQLVISFR